MGKCFLGICLYKDKIHAVLTENGESIMSLSEPLYDKLSVSYSDAVNEFIADLLGEYSPCGIGFTGLCDGIVYLDREGKAVSDIVFPYSDTEKECEEIFSLCGRTVSGECGLVTHYINKKQGTLPPGAYSFTSPASYFIMRMTGTNKPLLHISEAYNLGFYDNARRDFDSNAVIKCGIADLRYPEVTADLSVSGYYENIPVYTSIGIKQAEFFGCAGPKGALLEFSDKEYSVSYSSASETEYVSDALPLIGKDFLIKKSFSDLPIAEAALVRMLSLTSMATGGDLDIKELIDTFALSSVTERKLPPVRFDGGKIKFSAEYDMFTPSKLCAAFIKQTADTLHPFADKIDCLSVCGQGVLHGKALFKMLERVFGIEPTFSDMTFAAAKGAAVAIRLL